MFSVGVLPERHLTRDPGERNIGLSAAQLTECCRGDVCMSGHAGGGGEQAVAADVIAAKTDGRLRQQFSF